ncbi:MAG: DUF177 domain-containing protein [Melioribacteraceae bacterium]|nr:DUF177 domain-containing protein [Melioribacteraceae bacterium]
MSMQIKFTNYKDGLHKFVLKTEVEELSIEEKFAGTALLNCEMDKSSTQIIINCNLQVNAKQVCDRCTAEYEDVIETDFKNIYFLTNNRSSADEDESGIYYLSSSDDKIDLSGDTIENALLTLPMKVLCNKDCKGLCSICGVNKNEEECNCVAETSNPVWEKLLKLKGL